MKTILSHETFSQWFSGDFSSLITIISFWQYFFFKLFIFPKSNYCWRTLGRTLISSYRAGLNFIEPKKLLPLNNAYMFFSYFLEKKKCCIGASKSIEYLSSVKIVLRLDRTDRGLTEHLDSNKSTPWKKALSERIW